MRYLLVAIAAFLTGRKQGLLEVELMQEGNQYRFSSHRMYTRDEVLSLLYHTFLLERKSSTWNQQVAVMLDTYDTVGRRR